MLSQTLLSTSSFPVRADIGLDFSVLGVDPPTECCMAASTYWKLFPSHIEQLKRIGNLTGLLTNTFYNQKVCMESDVKIAIMLAYRICKDLSFESLFL